MGLLLGGCWLPREALGNRACTATTDCRADETCLDGYCHPQDDAGEPDAFVPLEVGTPDVGPSDTGLDTGGPDAGSCGNGMLDPGEADVDCGGSCAACAACAACTSASDCASGGCSEGRCKPDLATVSTPSGPVAAFVRDGYVLLAHYGPGTYTDGYDPHVAQRMTPAGGAAPAPGWAPDPCFESGHLDLSAFDPAGRAVRLECDDGIAAPRVSASSSLFTSFAYGDYGAPGTAGRPGWANIASVASGAGRLGYAECGAGTAPGRGGIAYCDGAGTSEFDNHLISYGYYEGGGNPYVGCGGMGCTGPTCDLHVWIWMQLP
jgi:hypothetical protein